jgi:REP element-mobilizing transposase RayT
MRACSILPEHMHLDVARHRYKAEQIANLLKGAGTRQRIADDPHPLRQYVRPDKRQPGMWARHQWKSFMDREAAIENAIAYVIENPIKEGIPRQNWNWITPYAGLEPGWTT